MRILVTGATGFLGRAIASQLAADGHTLVAWVRSPDRARALLGPGPELVDAAGGTAALARSVDGADAIVNLAGEPLVGERWSPARRRALVQSRVDATRAIVDAIDSASARPRVLASASAIGVYGDRGDETLDEGSSPGTGFLAELCQQWESAAQAAASGRTRVVLLRMGVVIGPGGGALAKMLTPFRLGVGGPIGSGAQWMSWVHLDDLVAIWRLVLADDRASSAINAVAPSPATSRDLAKALGRALHRPAVMPVPGLALRALYGEGASMLLDSQRVLPVRLETLGFTWRYPTLEAALRASL